VCIDAVVCVVTRARACAYIWAKTTMYTPTGCFGPIKAHSCTSFVTYVCSLRPPDNRVRSQLGKPCPRWNHLLPPRDAQP
jgi:hypothetical protein